MWSEIGSNVLLLPVLLVTLTTGLLWRALQAVPVRAVLVWCRAYVGKSRQQRFQKVLGWPKEPSTDSAGCVVGSQADEPAVTGRPPPEVGQAEEVPHKTEAACWPPPTGKVAA